MFRKNSRLSFNKITGNFKKIIFVMLIACILSVFLLITAFITTINQQNYNNASIEINHEGIYKANSPTLFSPNEKLLFKINLKSTSPFLRLFSSASFPRIALANEDKFDNQSIETKLFYISKNETEVKGIKFDITKESKDGILLSVNPPDLTSFKPGSYKLNVTLKNGNSKKVLTQNFSWGVLALNSDKSIYLPNETANIFFAVLDTKGKMVCDASLNLKIKTPTGLEENLSTDNGQIKLNPECYKYEYVEKADFDTTYTLKEKGEYQLILQASTKDGDYTISDSFEVRESVPFEVRRDGPTRIYPYSAYSMDIYIKANEDFKGVITEQIPNSFNITDRNTEIYNKENSIYTNISKDINQIIRRSPIYEKEGQTYIYWNTDFKKGESYKISYRFKAPIISPEFYLLGPLIFSSNLDDQSIFEEARQWQIASDATLTLRPNAAGDVTQLSQFPSSTSNYDKVSESSSDSDTTYVFNSTLVGSQYDLYNVANTTQTGNINSVAVSIVCRALSTTNGRRTYVSTKIKTNNTEYTGTETGALTTSYSTNTTTYTTNPQTGNAWTWTEINNLQIGANIRIENTSYQGRCTQEYATIDYDPPVTISGYVYQDEANTPTVWSGCNGTTNNVSLSVKGGTKESIYCDGSTGAFSFSKNVTAGDVITAFIDSASGDKGVLYTKAADNTTNITGLKLTKNRVWLRSENTVPIFNSDIDKFDKDDDTRIPITANTIQYDNGTTSSANSNTLTFSHTVTSAKGNAILLVGFAIRGGVSVSTVTYAGQNLTKIRHDQPGGDVRSELWYKVGPATGANNVVINMSGSQNFAVGAISFTGVNQSTPLGTDAGKGYNGAGATAKNYFTSAAGEVAVDVLASQGAGSYPFSTNPTNPDQKLLVNKAGGAGVVGMSMVKGWQSVFMSWRFTGTDYWATSAVPLKPHDGGLTVDSGVEIHVDSSKVFEPRGNVTTDAMHIQGRFEGNTETVTFTGIGTGSDCKAGAGTMRPLCLDSGIYRPYNDTTVFAGSSANTTIEGTTYNTLSIGTVADSNNITYTLTGNTTVKGTLTIGANSGTGTHTLSIGSNILTLKGTAPLTINSKGNVLTDTSTIVFYENNTNVPPLNYYNLQIGRATPGITYDTASSQTTTVSTNTITWQHTVTTAADRILVVGIDSRVEQVGVDVTYAGIHLTRLRLDPRPVDVTSELWYLLDPPSGTNDIVVTVGDNEATWMAGATSWSGVGQTPSLAIGTITGTTGTGGSTSLTVSSAVGEVVLDTVSLQSAATLGATSGQTIRWNSTFAGNAGSGSSKAGAASVTNTWSISGAGSTYATTAVSIKPAASTLNLGTTTSQTLQILNNLTVAGTANATTYNPQVIVGNDLIVNSGATYTASGSQPIKIGGNFTNNGTFTNSNGTVEFNDKSKISTITGSATTPTPAVTFYNLSSTIAGKTIKFTGGKTFRINGLFTLVPTLLGDNCNPNNTITIDSTSPPTKWLINHQGTENITNATIANSGCDGSSTQVSYQGVSGGTNDACWVRTSAASIPGCTTIKGNTVIKGNTTIK